MTNPHTGAQERTKPASQEYLDNFDRIFRKRKEEPEPMGKPIKDTEHEQND